MSEHIVSITRAKNGNVTIRGLRDPDLRLIRKALWDSAWGMDKGGPVSEAVDRLGSILSWVIPFDEGGYYSRRIDLISGSDPDTLYTERSSYE